MKKIFVTLLLGVTLLGAACGNTSEAKATVGTEVETAINNETLNEVCEV